MNKPGPDEQRLAEIKALANSNDEKGKRTFEMHARPMVWFLLDRLAQAEKDRIRERNKGAQLYAAAAERAEKAEKERDDWKHACGVNADASQRLSDACEKAEKERDEAREQIVRRVPAEMYNAAIKDCDAAESRLKVAVEALDKIAEWNVGDTFGRIAVQTAREALAAIRGQGQAVSCRHQWVTPEGSWTRCRFCGVQPERQQTCHEPAPVVKPPHTAHDWMRMALVPLGLTQVGFHDREKEMDRVEGLFREAMEQVASANDDYAEKLKAKHAKEVQAYQELLAEAADWLCPHTEAIEAWKKKNGYGREWCLDCHNWLSAPEDATLQERVRKALSAKEQEIKNAKT